MNWANVVTPELLVMAIPIVAIVSGTVMAVLKHRERMAMIERGMDPDAASRAVGTRRSSQAGTTQVDMGDLLELLNPQC